MNFSALTSDELIALLPAGNEDSLWELKAADVVSSAKRGEFRRELGKQVSAFANSGGGNLVIGISNDRKVQPCEKTVGRQPMKDYLASMVEQSVEYPIRHFRVHPIPVTGQPEENIFAIEIDDSPAAPHQAKDERIYYYRIDGHSKPAPHFHVELLRNRMTRAVLEITDIDYGIRSLDVDPVRMQITLNVTVENKSMQCATVWGVHVRHPSPSHRWTEHEGRDITVGFCARGGHFLLPSDRATLPMHLTGFPDDVERSVANYERLWKRFNVIARPVSQNYVGEEKVLSWGDNADWVDARNRLRRELSGFGLHTS
jgi:hypothetical protein